MSLALLFPYLMLNKFRMLIHPSSGACDFCVELFHGLYCSGSVCVGVTLWFGCGGVVSVCRLRQCVGLHTDTTARFEVTNKPQLINIFDIQCLTVREIQHVIMSKREFQVYPCLLL